jgi:hypothetical protein
MTVLNVGLGIARWPRIFLRSVRTPLVPNLENKGKLIRLFFDICFLLFTVTESAIDNGFHVLSRPLASSTLNPVYCPSFWVVTMISTQNLDDESLMKVFFERPLMFRIFYSPFSFCYETQIY